MTIPLVTITGSVATPSGGAPTEGAIIVKLSQPGTIAGAAVGGRQIFVLGPNGELPASFKLAPNDQIEPAGTVWEVSIKIEVNKKGYRYPEQFWQIASSPSTIDIGSVLRVNQADGVVYGPDQQTLAARDAAIAAAAQAAIDGASAGAAAGTTSGAIAGAAAAEPYATAAAGSAGAAATAQAAAEAARDAALATGKVYPDTATGLAAEAEGAYFNVPSGTVGEALVLYRKESGLAVEKKRTMSNRGQLAAWMREEAYRPSGTLAYNPQGRVASPVNIAWPDGATGVLTVTYNPDGTVASMSASHIDGFGTLTVAQPTITYVNGAPTVIPAITVT